MLDRPQYKKGDCVARRLFSNTRPKTFPKICYKFTSTYLQFNFNIYNTNKFVNNLLKISLANPPLINSNSWINYAYPTIHIIITQDIQSGRPT